MLKKSKRLNKGAVEHLDHPVIQPVDSNEITDEEKKRALKSLKTLARSIAILTLTAV